MTRGTFNFTCCQKVSAGTFFVKECEMEPLHLQKKHCTLVTKHIWPSLGIIIASQQVETLVQDTQIYLKP